MNDEQETNRAFARSLSNAGLGLLEPVAWIGRHKNDIKNDRLLIFQFKDEAEKWRDQYKVGYAWLDELIIKPNIKISGGR